MRLPLLFSEGVQKGRITLQQFVALTSANHAKLYGLYPQEGHDRRRLRRRLRDLGRRQATSRVRWQDLHDNVGYTPYEGREIKGWPITVVSRGRVVVEDGKLDAARGSGRFLPCASPDSAKPHGQRRARAAGDVAVRRQAAVLTRAVAATAEFLRPTAISLLQPS